MLDNCGQIYDLKGEKKIVELIMSLVIFYL